MHITVLLRGIGASSGLILGGFLTIYVSWRSGFLINIPICMLFIVYAYKKFPKFNYSKPQPIDLRGGITSIIAIFILILGLERINTAINGMNIALIIIGILLLIVFYFIEKRKALPLVNLDLFKNSVRTSGYILRF
ncbi:hypothetical protein [Staphylococcus gallinarum]|uniref:hypothetical protein n=1 Tax=Staphylococcus gallinarum TaxID=1293 RepID=UPI001E62A0AE|nr:hypothetical protein [Staphylococcus gallinarum]MCD8917145.1 hypothetical protein [Staphylococcus gallinarum]